MTGLHLQRSFGTEAHRAGGDEPVAVAATIPEAGQEPFAIATTPDGGRIYVVSRLSDGVFVYDANTLAEVGIENVGHTPVAIAITARARGLPTGACTAP